MLFMKEKLHDEFISSQINFMNNVFKIYEDHCEQSDDVEHQNANSALMQTFGRNRTTSETAIQPQPQPQVFEQQFMGNPDEDVDELDEEELDMEDED